MIETLNNMSNYSSTQAFPYKKLSVGISRDNPSVDNQVFEAVSNASHVTKSYLIHKPKEKINLLNDF